MKLYHWYSEVLKNYTQGNIIVMAGSVDEAREKALPLLKAEMMESQFWPYTSLRELNDEQLAEYVEYVTECERDLSAVPTIVESGVLLLSGSE